MLNILLMDHEESAKITWGNNTKIGEVIQTMELPLPLPPPLPNIIQLVKAFTFPSDI